MADLGAEVVKIEPPGGDDSRRMGPFEGDESYCFAQVNRNKRSIGLDIKDPRGLEILLALAKQSDFFVENFRPGTATRLGCGYDAIRRVRPDVIYCSVSGYGQTGPYATRPAYDIVTQGVGGFLSFTGHPGAPPAKIGIAINDIAGATTAVQAMLAAHIARLNGSGGQYVDLSLVECALAWTVWEAAAFFGTGEVPTQTGTRHRRSAPYQAFKTRDGYITIGANTERMWRALCQEVLERPDLLEDKRYSTSADRVRYAADLEADIESVLLGDGTEHWVARLLAAGVAAGPVNRYDEALGDPQAAARGLVTQVRHPTMGMIDVLASPLRLSATPPEIRRHPPRFGEHTLEILSEAGVSDDDAAVLVADGVALTPAGDSRRTRT
jgi:crotonobetainyl-CoA:carnitine CoA-transferase CaiB-like acyl-CoA transferase